MKLSPQQQAFIDWAKKGTGSCVLEAVAGAGKTTTILAAVKGIPGTVAMLAFNKAIAAELKEKLQKQGLGDKADAGTMHSFGSRAYRRTFKDAKVERNKVRDIAEKAFGHSQVVGCFLPMICKLVSLAKQRAIGCNGQGIADMNAWWDIAQHFDVFAMQREESRQIPETDIINAAIQTLRLSIEKTDIIDFDDMIYMPLKLDLPFWQYDVVMVDEAQDTNPARRLMVKKLLKKNGRVIAVGDRHQAIYGFTGADNDSLDLIAADFNATRMPLTTTYRCPKAVVSFAKQWVSHIEAHESAPEGLLSSANTSDLATMKNLHTSAILCRNTKPIVELAMSLIRKRIACKVEGRDIGENIKKLIRRWRVKSLHSLKDKLEDYLERERAKLLQRKQDTKVGILEDTVATVQVIVDQCITEGKTSIEDAEAYVDELFDEDVKGMLVLSTIHKSKGREWERVFWLDRQLTCPSKWAKQDWQRAQEVNLMYVAATRAKHELVELHSATTDNAPAPAASSASPTVEGRKSVEQLKKEKRDRARARRQRAKEQQ